MGSKTVEKYSKKDTVGGTKMVKMVQKWGKQYLQKIQGVYLQVVVKRKYDFVSS